MLERLRARRDRQVIQLNNVLNENLDAIVEQRLQDFRTKIIEEVKEEHAKRINEEKEKVAHFDYVIEQIEQGQL